jgi:transcriptional regulator with XRE-family HTH domain
MKSREKMTTENNYKNLSRIIKQQRTASELTLRGLSAISGVSSSHLGRIEKGARFPSAHVLQRIAKPLGFEESELFALAGYLSSAPPTEADVTTSHSSRRLDPLVSRILSQEPVELQRTVVTILTILKSLAKVSE